MQNCPLWEKEAAIRACFRGDVLIEQHSEAIYSTVKHSCLSSLVFGHADRLGYIQPSATAYVACSRRPYCRGMVNNVQVSA